VADELSNRIAKTGLRWLAIIPATAVAWALTAALGGGLLKVAVHLCPPEQLVSGMCRAPWYRNLEEAVIVGWAALLVALTVTVPAVIAPSHRGSVATVALVAAAAALLPAAYMLGWWGSFTAAVLAGVLSWLTVLRWERK
jgi:hypothetical protein